MIIYTILDSEWFAITTINDRKYGVKIKFSPTREFEKAVSIAIECLTRYVKRLT